MQTKSVRPKPVKAPGGGVGRPTAYKPEYDAMAEVLTAKGFTMQDLADFFGVNRDVVFSWQKKHPTFAAALEAGRETSDTRVVRALFDRAIGYSHPEDDIRTISTPGGGSEIVITPTIKRYPPDATSMIFWLKNRRPQEWRDKVTQEITGADGGPLRVIKVPHKAPVTEDTSVIAATRSVVFPKKDG